MKVRVLKAYDAKDIESAINTAMQSDFWYMPGDVQVAAGVGPGDNFCIVYVATLHRVETKEEKKG